MKNSQLQVYIFSECLQPHFAFNKRTHPSIERKPRQPRQFQYKRTKSTAATTATRNGK